jgi:glycosyltransferase involved in cell wall biosynthesis
MRLVYLENGVNVEHIHRYPHRTRKELGVRFTYLGSLAWQKGVHVLVEAIRGIEADRAVLKVYGDPTVFPDYAAQLRRIADLRNTVFGGQLPNEEVGRVLAETDVLLVPSLWYENSPVVIQEAFAAGVPVIASRIGALAEKVRDGVDGVLCTAGDVRSWRACLLSIIEHVDRLKEYRANLPKPMTMGKHVELLARLYARCGAA